MSTIIPLDPDARQEHRARRAIADAVTESLGAATGSAVIELLASCSVAAVHTEASEAHRLALILSSFESLIEVTR
jgi:hypothetical protein